MSTLSCSLPAGTSWRRSARSKASAIGRSFRFVSIPSLIRMKEIAGRPQDKIDVEHLRKLADAAK